MKQASIFMTALVMAGGVAWYAMAEKAGLGGEETRVAAKAPADPPRAPSLRPDRRGESRVESLLVAKAPLP